MNSIWKKVVPLAAFVAVLAAGSARASVVEANIPFDFVVHGQTLPAGRYLLERDDNQPSILVIHDRGGSHSNIVVLTEPAGTTDPAGDRAALRFTRHGSQYYLADVWRSRNDGWEIEGAAKGK